MKRRKGPCPQRALWKCARKVEGKLIALAAFAGICQDMTDKTAQICSMSMDASLC